MARLAPLGKFRAFTNAGAPLAGGKLYTYEANTSTPKPTYTDESEDTENANPVVLDSNGYADVWFEGGAYKLILKDSTDQTLWTIDDVASDEARSFGYATATLSSTTAITSVYDNYFLICTATLTLSLLPAASAGDGFFFIVKNTGSGTVTIDPSDAETIDGASTTTILTGGSAIVQCNGSSWQTIGKTVPYAAASASGAASLEFAEDTDNGTNKVTLIAPATLASDVVATLPSATGTITTNADKLSVFSATTSDELRGVISDETGSGGGLVFATGPTLSNPIVGTQAPGDNSTKAASTAFVTAALAAFTGLATVTKQVFTASGTYTPTAGMDYCIIECIGSGGGSGGSAAAAGQAGNAGGGGGYAWSVVTAATIGASQVVTIGAGGAAGSTGPGAGGNGNATSVGAVVVAGGGTGGPVNSATAPCGGVGGAGGVGTTGDFLGRGQPGGTTHCGATAAQSVSGPGGNSILGGGAVGRAGSGAGIAGSANTGGGASGAVAAGAATAGQIGGSGLVRIIEFC